MSNVTKSKSMGTSEHIVATEGMESFSKRIKKLEQEEQESKKARMHIV